jgi:anti-anti-sigma factor
MSLQINTESSEQSTLYFILDGKLDTITAPDLEQFIEEKIDRNIKTLVFNLEKLSFLSSAGLRIFAKTRKMMKARQGKLYFVNLSPQVQKVFDIVKAVPVSEVFQKTEELDAYLTTMQNKIDRDRDRSTP